MAGLSEKPPAGVRIETLPDDIDPISEPDAQRFIGGSIVTLLYMTQIAAISQDPWFSRVQSPEFADSGVAVMIGVHVQPRLEQGHFAAPPGPVNAAADQFTIVVNGLPGHAAYPHLTADPVVAAADLIGTLQHLVSRQVDPTNPTVLTVGSISGGNSPNVVPSNVRMTGILRTFDEEDRTRLHEAIGSAAWTMAQVHGCEAEVEVSRGAPVLDNEPELTTAAAIWLERAGLHQNGNKQQAHRMRVAAPSSAPLPHRPKSPKQRRSGRFSTGVRNCRPC